MDSLPPIAGRSSNGTPLFNKKCPDCGAVALVDRRKLGSPCHPCAMKRRATHGMSKSPLYARYSGILARCKYASHPHYKYYGGRGIKVCAEWASSFEAFASWAAKNGWDSSLELDRIDPNGDYSPDNCRFISHRENSQLRRNSRITIEQADEVRKKLSAGDSVNSVSRALFVPYMTVWHIKNKGTWKRDEQGS